MGYTQDGGVSETTETVTDPTTGATTTQNSNEIRHQYL